MRPKRTEKILQLTQQCKKLLGFNFPILIEESCHKYEQEWQLQNSDAAAQSALSVVQTLFNQQQFELHQTVCVFFLHDLKLIPQSIYMAEIYRQLALNYDLQGNSSLAEQTYNEAFEFLGSIKTNNEPLKWKLYASLWYNRSSPSRSAESKEKLVIYTRNALHFFEYLHDVEGMSLCLNRLALLLPDDDYTEKFELLRRVLSINSGPKGNKKSIAMAQFNIGYFTFLSGEEKLGIAYMNDALDLVIHHSNSRYWALAQLQMAKAFFKREKFIQAREACLKSLEVFKSLQVKSHIQEAETLIQKIDSAK